MKAAKRKDIWNGKEKEVVRRVMIRDGEKEALCGQICPPNEDMLCASFEHDGDSRGNFCNYGRQEAYHSAAWAQAKFAVRFT